MGNFIGIDLGTTFSAVATLDESGRPAIVHNSEGANVTPSVVSFTGPESVLVGEVARKAYGYDPNTLGRFKRFMGTEQKFAAGGREHSPSGLSALVLKKLADDAGAALGGIAEAVVTIPANFANEAREATMNAAKSAGLTVKHIINEPTAAALYYAFKSGETLAGTYAVYDLGGGTFDVSVIRVSGQDVEVVATDGVARLGGDDFDEAIRKIVADKYKQETGEDMDPADFTKNDAEDEKRSLSKRDKVLVPVRSVGGRANITITRSEFEEAISSLIAQTEMVCEEAMDQANVDAADIKGVFLAGGSTRIPCVLESVRRTFRQEPISNVNVDEVVALGAALYAAYKTDQSQLNAIQTKSVQKIKVAEITSKCFGTLSVIDDTARGGFKRQNSIIIKKGEKIPHSVTESFYTVHENQEAVNCTVTESNAIETDPRFVREIWRGNLELPGGRPANQEIQVTYTYDENQIMHCQFLDVESGQKSIVDLSLGSESGQGDNAIDKFTVE